MRLILIIVFVGSGIFCFSEEETVIENQWQVESLIYLEKGNEYLFLHEPISALENFQRASSFLDTSDNSANVIGFLISFGQVIAYDILGFREHCKQSLG